MKITRKNLKKLASSVGYNPERMGIALLHLLGYSVSTYDFSDSVYVQDPKGKLVYYKSR